MDTNNNSKQIGNKFLVTKTDLKGNITYANTYFIHICGLSEQELIGQPHNIIRHPDMPKFVFKFMWQELVAGNEFWGYVKNKTPTGHYWVLAHVTPNIDQNNNKIGYHSNRRLASPSAIQTVEKLYTQLRNEEAKGGIVAAKSYLHDLLNKQGVTYNEFVFSI